MMDVNSKNNKEIKTMDETYGDGSKHLCCPYCGYCMTCGDCKKYGCGRPENLRGDDE